MDPIVLELPVLGVKVLEQTVEGCEAPRYSGVSWCDAVRRATFGEELLVTPGSIDICKWSPVVLGLKVPETTFEKSLELRLEGPTAGVYVAPLWRFDQETPDVLIVRGRQGQLRDLASRLGPGALTEKFKGRIGWSALGVGQRGPSGRVMLSRASNRALAYMRRSRNFDKAVKVAFKNDRVNYVFERMAKNAVADMSVCRNSVVVPLIEDAGNISFFCTGGVSWGGNSPSHMTSGFPGRMLDAILAEVEFPGKS